MKANKKKIIVLVSMVLLLVGTGLLNFFLNTGVQPPAQGGPGDQAQPSFFYMVRRDRETLREAELDILREVVATSQDESILNDAHRDKMAISRAMSLEFEIETLIRGRGIEDVVVTISRNMVNVVVQSEELDVTQANQIMFVILQETDFTPEEIIIMPYV